MATYFETKAFISTLVQHRDLPEDALIRLLGPNEDDALDESLFAEADRIRREYYGDAVYLRGLIEFTNYCKNNCFYCGIRADNCKLRRYRLDKETILNCCREGYGAGFRTFVLQGGEDPYFAEPSGSDGAGNAGDDRLCDIVSSIHDGYPDCAVTLSVGERSRESYKRLFDAGARRYLLRHEAASADLYSSLHPAEMRLENRKRCLHDLKEIGYQFGAGLMVGAPGQTAAHLLEDLRFMQMLQPDMIGIGPYLPHGDTPFGARLRASQAGARKEETAAADFHDSIPKDVTTIDSTSRLRLTLRLLAVLRIVFPYALIPATTALGTIDPQGYVLGLKAGTNVIMPNLSPAGVRDQYAIYENKLQGAENAAQGRALPEKQVTEAGYHIVTDIGDAKREDAEHA